MTQPYSEDLRERALARADAGESVRAIAAALGFSPSCVSKWKKRRRETGSLSPGQMGGHKKRVLAEDNAQWLRARIKSGPFTTRKLVAGLDLGSTKTCAVIAEVVGDLPRSPVAKILGVGLAKNGGVRRGMVRDIEETTRSVVSALRDAERMAGAKVAAVTCGIAGEHVSARTSQGVVAVAGDEVTSGDVGRVNEVARAGSAASAEPNCACTSRALEV